MSDDTTVQFDADATYYDGRPNFMGAAMCTLSNERLIVQGGGRTVQIPTSDISNYVEGRWSRGKDVDITIANMALIKLSFKSRSQAYWLHSALRDAIAGRLPDPVPQFPPDSAGRNWAG
jgi:hypothetical protein